MTLQPADRGDTTSIGETLRAAMENLDEVRVDGAACRIEAAVTDQGYHSNDVVRDLADMGIRSYVSEPDRGRRRWKGKAPEREAVYANRRRIRGARGRRLLRKRGELLERPFAHCYETGGMRRTHLRGHSNILKRLLIHVGAGNLGLLMRRLFGFGTPRALQDLAARFQAAAAALHHHLPACTPTRIALSMTSLLRKACTLIAARHPLAA